MFLQKLKIVSKVQNKQALSAKQMLYKCFYNLWPLNSFLRSIFIWESGDIYIEILYLITTMLCPIKFNSNAIELTVHTIFVHLDLLRVTRLTTPGLV